MTKVQLFYFNAGGGHRAAASALQSVLAVQRADWTVEAIDLFRVLDPQRQFLRLTGMAPEKYYNVRLAMGWTLGLAQELKVLQGLIRIGHRRLIQALQKHWNESEPDLVVSLVPNFNRALCESLTSTLPGVPYVTVMRDLADHPPNFWIEPGCRQHVVCGTAKAIQQAAEAGCADEYVHRTSGMIIRPDFYRIRDSARSDDRSALGLDPAELTGVVLFGGQGSSSMLSIARQLPDFQLVFLCGRNEALADKLQKLIRRSGVRQAVVGYTSDVAHYMRLSDFFIGKPGPGSISEALQQGLPIVTVRNAWTMPQERYNTEWIVEQDVGVVGRSMRDIRPSVVELARRLDHFKVRVEGHSNRALFEVPSILTDILQRHDAQAAFANRASRVEAIA